MAARFTSATAASIMRLVRSALDRVIARVFLPDEKAWANPRTYPPRVTRRGIASVDLCHHPEKISRAADDICQGGKMQNIEHSDAADSPAAF